MRRDYNLSLITLGTIVLGTDYLLNFYSRFIFIFQPEPLCLPGGLCRGCPVLLRQVFTIDKDLPGLCIDLYRMLAFSYL